MSETFLHRNKGDSIIMAKLIAIISLPLALSGCAGYLNAWTNDPLQHHSVGKPAVYTMTGDRRTAVFLKPSDGMHYCAESLPDAVAALAASSSASLKANGLKGGAGGEATITDATTVSLLQTFQRTEITELSRQLGWSTCLAWAQGAITNDQYHAILKDIVSGSLEIMKTRASQQQNIAATTTSSGPEKKIETKTETAAVTKPTTAQ
jgi:hypothetical protein